MTPEKELEKHNKRKLILTMVSFCALTPSIIWLCHDFPIIEKAQNILQQEKDAQQGELKAIGNGDDVSFRKYLDQYNQASDAWWANWGKLWL